MHDLTEKDIPPWNSPKMKAMLFQKTVENVFWIFFLFETNKENRVFSQKMWKSFMDWDRGLDIIVIIITISVYMGVAYITDITVPYPSLNVPLGGMVSV
jgi:hypothetical protein